jgi:mono/diheme cytochrome c family protein
MKCVTCHGPTGKGDGPLAAGLKDDWNQPIRPRDFATIGLFKCGNDEADLFRTIQNGLGGTPMASFREALFVGGDGFPAGSLADRGSPADVAALERYLATQPTAAALAAMSPAAKQELEAHRTWALVRYVRSLLKR